MSDALSPFNEISREDWAELGISTELPLTESEIQQIRGLGDFLDIKEVQDVYLPLSRLLNHLDENHGARAGGALWGTEDTGWALVGGLVFWAGLLALVGWLLWRWLA